MHIFFAPDFWLLVGVAVVCLVGLGIMRELRKGREK